MTTSGDGYVTVADGTTRWGLYGAAGLLLRHVDETGERFFLAHRSPFTHGGACWGIPGGARNRYEPAPHAAFREFIEEVAVAGSGFPPQAGEIIAEHVVDNGGWTYTTVVIAAETRQPLTVSSWEHTDAGWFTRDEIADLNLHPAFKAALPTLYALIDGPPDTAPACPGCGHHHVTDPPRCAETPCAADCPECNDTGIVWLCDLGQHTKCQGYACTCDCHGSNE